MSKRIDLTGQRFGRLIVIKNEAIDESRKCLCLCDCGNEKVINRYSLLNGDTRSCGCLHREIFKKITTKHGQSNTKIYNIYNKMINRCNNPKDKKYSIYGGRGITVCDEWLNSFEAFFEWAIKNGFKENTTQKECSLDRIDVNGNYEPDNCRWATAKQQANNKRNNHFLTYQGETHTICEWGDITGLSPRLIESRIVKHNWSAEKALTTQPRRCLRREKYLELNGEKHTLDEWAEITHIKKSTLQCRRDKGWSDVDILTTPYMATERTKKKIREYTDKRFETKTNCK